MRKVVEYIGVASAVLFVVALFIKLIIMARRLDRLEQVEDNERLERAETIDRVVLEDMMKDFDTIDKETYDEIFGNDDIYK